MKIYTFKGIKYKIVEDKFKDDPLRPAQLIRDFEHCEEIRDWVTIKNRIANGIMWGWLKEVK